MMGTAAPAVTWVLIEHRGGWPPNGFDGLDLDPTVKAAVNEAARAHRARILLIRRHGPRSRGGAAAWAVLRHDPSGTYRQRWGTWTDDHDLAALPSALEDSHLASTESPPVLLVCAHAQHDVCCAVRGRPVAQSLTERWPDLVWECSHVGGDRFAANLVVVPDGVYYGNLDVSTAVATVEQHLAGQITPDQLRGYSDLIPPQQCAVVETLRRYGPAGRHDLHVVDTTRDGDRWTVRLVGDILPGPVTVELLAHRTAPHQLTCRGLQPSSAVHHEVVDLRLS